MHSFAETPLCTDGTNRRPSFPRYMSKPRTLPQPPNRGLAQPNTTCPIIPICTIAEVHIMQGSQVTYNVSEPRSGRGRFVSDNDSKATSSACAVAFPRSFVRLDPVASTVPDDERIAHPTGTSPRSRARRASCKAVSIYEQE